jgi:hypothetical protein
MLTVLSELYKPRSYWVCNLNRLNSRTQMCTLKNILGVSYCLQHGYISTDQLNYVYVTMTAILWHVQPMNWHVCHLHVILNVANKRRYSFTNNTLMSYHTAYFRLLMIQENTPSFITQQKESNFQWWISGGIAVEDSVESVSREDHWNRAHSQSGTIDMPVTTRRCR